MYIVYRHHIHTSTLYFHLVQFEALPEVGLGEPVFALKALLFCDGYRLVVLQVGPHHLLYTFLWRE